MRTKRRRGKSTMEGAGEAARRLACALALAAAPLLLSACGGGDDPDADADSAGAAGDTAEAYVRPSSMETDLTAGDTIPGHPSWTEQDFEVLVRTVDRARSEGWDRLPVGERIARIGETFVGTEYIPQTLDPPGPETLVINLRALDCVTFVENVLALAHYVRSAPTDLRAERERALGLYEDVLTSIRYRDGRIDGYPSRLHYFSEWIHDNEEAGWVENVTDDLGGVPQEEPIDFMTNHRDSYRQLTGLEDFEAIGRIEERLTEMPRWQIPQEELASVQDGIEVGDVLALTSTLDGLDVAHTGIAVRDEDGVLRLLNAPLVGESVQVSEKSLVDRLQGISSQDGVMVARPLEVQPGQIPN